MRPPNWRGPETARRFTAEPDRFSPYFALVFAGPDPVSYDVPIEGEIVTTPDLDRGVNGPRDARAVIQFEGERVLARRVGPEHIVSRAGSLANTEGESE